MKLLAINGSPRKGNTSQALKRIGEAFTGIDFEVLHLADLDFKPCRGCYTCVLKGESKCPLKDDRDMILRKIAEADGFILASPVYSHMVSSPMKNFFDRFGYLAHRPQFFNKYAMSMVTYSGYGAEEAMKYMDKMLSSFGFNLAPPLVLQFRPEKIPEKNAILNREKSKRAVKILLEKIEKGERTRPSLNKIIPFNVFKYVSKLDKELMKADYEYYKDKGDYYFETKIPFYKKIIAKKLTDKIISQFD
jgi:multimeric flavodoxin WrbA